MGARIQNIYRYPVKSIGGHSLDGTDIAANGIPGDRCWTLKDETRGSIKGGKRFPELMGMNAALTAEPSAQNPSPPAQITLADGRVLTTVDADAASVLSEAVGAPVSVWPLLPKEQLDHYRREAPDPSADMQAALREVFARTPDEPLPDLSQFPAELMQYESPPGTYFDAYPLLLMSTSALQAMAAADTSSNFDVRRFRPNIVLATDDEGFAEEAWIGKDVRLGTTRLRIEIACPRCVMTTHGFAELPKDPNVMRALVRANSGNLGVYASVVEPGRIAVGDVLEIVG